MKTARQMFEELGFQLQENTGFFDWVIYENHKKGDIEFCLSQENVEINVMRIDSRLLQAIQKQMQELGWLDE